jgi:hypothetical protein
MPSRSIRKLSFIEAASVWIMFITASGALIQDAKVTKGVSPSSAQRAAASAWRQFKLLIMTARPGRMDTHFG